MARVELAAVAVEDLERLIQTHSLPADTRGRVARPLRSLELFPRLGRALSGRWEWFRFVLGPWRWMLLVYVVIDEDDRVVVVTLQDGRSSAPPNLQIPRSGSGATRACRTRSAPRRVAAKGGQ